ncbi:MAG: histidine phosphatase family protein [Caulobacterales bacterium]
MSAETFSASTDVPASPASTPADVPAVRSAIAPKIGSITLARHGRPSLTRYIDLDWQGYEEWWRAYDLSGLAPGQTTPPKLIQAAAAATRIYCSPLRRAMETAAAAAPNRDLITDPIFTEAPLPPPRYPRFVKMNPSSWGWGWHARVFWWMGFSRGMETRDQAKERAALAVDKVIRAADSGFDVMVCGHGWFNRMMRPELQRRGWKCVRDGGESYWSFRRYEYRGH